MEANRVRHNVAPNVCYADGHVSPLPNAYFYGADFSNPTKYIEWKIFWYYENTNSNGVIERL